jgi:cytochrome c oxidase cbb3-type subunit 2
MKGLLPLFLGLFGTFAFSWIGLTVIPNYQIGHLDPQMDEEGTDVYPLPKSGMADRGRRVYSGNGCFYCHSEQVRPDYIASDIDRKWGERRSAPRDYIFARPVLLGKMRMGPDLSNLGKRAPAEDQNAPPAGASPAASPAPAAAPAAAGSPATKPGASPAASAPPATSTSSPAANASPAPSPPAARPNSSPAVAAASVSPAAANAAPAQSASPAGSLDSASANGEPLPYSVAWHHKHLYAPRSITLDTNMPSYRFLYEKRRISGEPSADALKLTGRDAPPGGWEIVPSYEAKCLVAYLMSLDQSHPLNEVKSAGSAPKPVSPAPAASPAAPARPK